MIHFITGNAGKFRELSELIPGLRQLNIDLDEIQSLDPQVVIEHKLAQAAVHHPGEIIVDDTSLMADTLGGLPGTFIKWFDQAIGWQGFAELVERTGKPGAQARTVLGYRDAQSRNHFFTGTLRGRIVPPRENGGFGWDGIFQPAGYNETFAELGAEKKARISMRTVAAKQLAAHLATHP